MAKTLSAERMAEIASIRRRQYGIIFFIVGASIVAYGMYKIMLGVLKNRDIEEQRNAFEEKVKYIYTHIFIVEY